MANELGQPTAQEIAEKFCTEMLCNALLCDGCPVQAIQHAFQQSFAADLRQHCGHHAKYLFRLGNGKLICGYCGASR